MGRPTTYFDCTMGHKCVATGATDIRQADCSLSLEFSIVGSPSTGRSIPLPKASVSGIPRVDQQLDDRIGTNRGQVVLLNVI